jgi:hypothetical protein
MMTLQASLYATQGEVWNDIHFPKRMATVTGAISQTGNHVRLVSSKQALDLSQHLTQNTQ